MTPDNLLLLDSDESRQRLSRLAGIMTENGLDYMLVNDIANLYYLTGRVYCGFCLVSTDGTAQYFVRRPSTLTGNDVRHIHKVEEIAPLADIPADARIGLEMDATPYSVVERYKKAFSDKLYGNASPLLRKARAVKTQYEIAKMRYCGERQAYVYSQIPALYRAGMTDYELQIEIEHLLRRAGCLGQFRTNGQDMELHMGNVLTGDNADNPSAYDFAMGGEGMDPSLPVGADGTIIREGCAVMIDVNGNFNGYMTDMTRCYCPGELSSPLARKALQASIDICAAIADAGRPGKAASELYELARAMAADAGLEEYFMGHRAHAGFVGHGVGIEINELPVLAPRSRDILTPGNCIAIEPKFVIPDGAVGIENTYIVMPDGPMQCITNAPEHIISLGIR